MKYKRILLKLSGEALQDSGNNAILSKEKLSRVASQISEIHKQGFEIMIVIGAGNIWRGKLASTIGVERTIADYMGMLGTIINAVALQAVLTDYSIDSRVMSSIEVKSVCEPYIHRKAKRHLEKGRIIIFAGGTGNPYFTTDTTAALRAMELSVDAVLMAKNGVNGVYDSDPNKNPKAKFIENITFQELLEQNLKVMDQTAVSLLLNNPNVTVHVFDMDKENSIVRVVNGDKIGTIVKKVL